MGEILVFRPDVTQSAPTRLGLASRRELPESAVIGLIPNGKPLATELLSALGDVLQARVGRDVELELLAKPSAAYSISAHEADVMAARAHFVITGVGD